MKKTKYIFIGIILSVSIQFIACGTEGSPTDLSESNGYRTELTEEEMEGGHVSFQMDGNLVVDADIRQIYQGNNGTLYAFDVNWSNYARGRNL